MSMERRVKRMETIQHGNERRGNKGESIRVTGVHCHVVTHLPGPCITSLGCSNL
jgi:hypothetical protein